MEGSGASKVTLGLVSWLRARKNASSLIHVQEVLNRVVALTVDRFTEIGVADPLECMNESIHGVNAMMKKPYKLTFNSVTAL